MEIEQHDAARRHTRAAQGRLPRLAASSYLNTAPLIWSFLDGSLAASVRLVTDKAPARSAELLAVGAVDAALVPVIEFARIPGVELVPDVCVGARRQAQSVVLVTDGRELSDVTSVKLDAASRTSVALTRIIFREFLNRQVEFTVAPHEDLTLRAGEAQLIIGDPAMRLDATRFGRVFDLAEVWRDATGCGFIFAMWMRRWGAAHTIDFARARDEGLAHTDEIVERYAGNMPLTRAALRAYLHQSIAYRPDDSMLEGMNLFFRLAHKHGLIESLPDSDFRNSLQR